MNPQTQELINQIQRLTEKVQQLETKISEENIRNTIFFDQDSNSTQNSTTVITGVNFGAQTTTSAAIALATNLAKFARVYFRGKAYNVPLYTIK